MAKENNNNNSELRVYTAETDKLLKELMEKNGDLNRIGALRYPEAQKSPKEQAKVADTLLNMLKNGTAFPVYTHSESIVCRLIRRIVEDGLEGEEIGWGDVVKIYFAEEKDGEVELHEFEIDSQLGPQKWPQGFFKHNVEENKATFEAAIRKKNGAKSAN